MLKQVLLFTLIFSFSTGGSAQSIQPGLLQTESTLKGYFISLYNSENDQTRDSLNTLIIELFSTSLKSPESYTYVWDSLDMIGRLTSPDQKLKVYTWYLQNTKGNYSYFGFMQYNAGSTKRPEIRFYSLSDKSRGMKNPETHSLSPENWLGCLYYKSFLFTFKRESFYTLLGYHFNNEFSDKKYIEVLRFNKEGNAIFGGEFQSEFQTVKRVIMEYSSQLVTSIRYDEKLRMIVFDHLSPFEPMFTGNNRFYGPDGSYDGYRFHKGKFILQKDIDARNLQ